MKYRVYAVIAASEPQSLYNIYIGADHVIDKI